MTELTIKSPADIFDLADYSGARTAVQWAVAKEMLAGGKSFYVTAGGEPLGLFGVYDLPDACGEAWFSPTPAASRHMLALVRAIRLTLPGLGYREIVTICTSPIGVRIAAACGFERAGDCDLGEIRCRTF